MPQSQKSSIAICPECKSKISKELEFRALEGEYIICEVCGFEIRGIKDIISRSVKSGNKKRNKFHYSDKKKKEDDSDEWREEWDSFVKSLKEFWGSFGRKTKEFWKNFKNWWKDLIKSIKKQRRKRKKYIDDKVSKRRIKKSQSYHRYNLQSGILHDKKIERRKFLVPKFDPLTGKRINQNLDLQSNQEIRYDPLTGKQIIIFSKDDLDKKESIKAEKEEKIKAEKEEKIKKEKEEKIDTKEEEKIDTKEEIKLELIEKEKEKENPPKEEVGEIKKEKKPTKEIKKIDANQIYTVLEPDVREHLLKLEIEENDRNLIAKSFIYLNVAQQRKYLTEIEDVNKISKEELENLIVAINKLPIPKNQQVFLINQLDYIPEHEHKQFVECLEDSENSENLEKDIEDLEINEIKQLKNEKRELERLKKVRELKNRLKTQKKDTISKEEEKKKKKVKTQKKKLEG